MAEEAGFTDVTITAEVDTTVSEPSAEEQTTDTSTGTEETEDQSVEENESDDASEDEATDDTESSDENSEDEEADDTQAGEPKTRGERRNEELQTKIREAVEQSRAVEQELAQKSNELALINRQLAEKKQEVEFVPHTEDEYIAAGYTEQEAITYALRDRETYRDIQSQEAQTGYKFSMSASQVLNDIPRFNPNNKETFNEKQMLEVSKGYEKFAQPVWNKDGSYKGGSFLPYDFMKFCDQLISMGAEGASTKAQKAVEKMVSVADVSSGSKAPVQKIDPTGDPAKALQDVLAKYK